MGNETASLRSQDPVLRVDIVPSDCSLPVPVAEAINVVEEDVAEATGVTERMENWGVEIMD